MNTGFSRGVRSAGHLVIIFSIIFCSLMVQGADLDKARQWLISMQNQGGSWGAGAKQPTDTPEAFLTLYHAGKSGEFLDKAVNWTVSGSPENTAGIARSLYVLSHSNGSTDALKAKLLSFQNADGGFGISKGYNSSPLMSMMALRSLVECGSVERTPIEKSMDYLSAMQKSDGGWTLQEKDIASDSSDILLSGWILSTVREYQLKQAYYPTNVCLMVSRGAAFLESKQNADGSWGDPADTAATALSITSLLLTTRPESAITNAAAWLEGRQLADGSFSGDIYMTAIAARCLELYYNNPFPEPPDLEIAATDMSFSPLNPLTSDQILIMVKVRNIGGSAAQNVGVQCYDGNPGGGGTAIGPELALTSIGPGSFGTVRLGVYLQAGTHEIFVKADPMQKVMEGNEENNTASSALMVASAQISQADLEIIADNMAFNVPDPAFPNQIGITALVENRGETVAANAIVQLFDGTAQIGKDFVLEKVFGLGSYAFELTTVLPPGTRNITVKIDPYSQIPEPNEKNNTASKEVTVTNLPPAVPQNLTGSAADGTAYLSWTANTEPDIRGYNVYRNGVKINSSAILASGYTENGLANGLAYLYRITSIDLYGAESGFSQELALTPLADTVNKPVITFPASKQAPGYLAAASSDIEGTAKAGDSVEISVNGTLRATVAAAAGSGETVVTAQSDWMSGNISDSDSYLVACWNFNENSGSEISDAKGGHDGTIYGSGDLWVSGKNNSALDFEGDDHVNIDGSSGMVLGDNATISLWIRLTTPSQPTVGIINKRNNNSGSSHTVMLSGNGIYTAADCTGYIAYTGPASLDSDWHHIVCIWKTPNMYIYKDGILASSGSWNGSSLDNTIHSWQIGYHGAWNSYFTGQLDEICFWNCALTSEEISSLYNSGAGKFYPEWEGEASSGGTANSNVDPVSTPGDLKIVSGRLSGYNRKIFGDGSPSVWGQLSWNADTPAGTSVKFRSRSAAAADALAAATWSPYYTISGSGIVSHSDRYLEIEACLESKDPDVTPVLHDYRFGSPDGAFTASGVSLNEGENTITAIAKRGTLESSVSDPAKVYVTLNVDLAVSANDISFSPASPGAEEPVSIVANVKNNGLGTASNVKVRFFDGSPDSGGIQMGDGFIIPSLGPAETANLTLSTYLSAGMHSIYMEVDRENTVPESDENNNIASGSVTVAPAVLLPPDFEIKDSDISFSGSNPNNLDVITINASVKNIGGTKAEILKIAVFDGNPSEGGTTQIGDDIVFNNLNPQSTATVGLQAMLSPGTHSIYVVADPDNNVSEINEQNNRAFKSITVAESPQSPSDLAIQNANITFSNPAPTATDLFTIGAVVVNQGGISANNVLIRFYDGDPLQGGAQLGGDLAFSGIAPGGHAQANLETALPAGSHRIYVSADPSNTILESDERNNTAYADIEVQPAPLPDIFIDQNEVIIPAGEIRQGDRVSIMLKVRNIGEGQANKVKIRLYQGVSVGGGIKVARDLELSIAPGEFATATLGWCAAVGTHTLYIEADPDGILPETDEYNNTASVALTALPSQSYNPVTDPEIQAAVDKGVAWLKTHQNSDGSWSDGWYGGHGMTSLALLALLHGGLDENDPAVAKGLSFIDNYGGGYEYSTYSPALTLMAYQATGNKTKYFDRVQDLFNKLIGWYYYGSSFDYGDMSNTQYGYLGVYAASQWNIIVPENITGNAISSITGLQHGDGGWDYGWGMDSYGSMTCAGAMILRMFNIPASDSRIQRGINWLDSHFTVNTNPNSWLSGTTYYYLYSMERAMSIPTLIEKIGEHDWYKEGSAFIVGTQASEGYWSGDMGGTVATTCFALLFLERAVPEISHSDLIVSNVGFSSQNPIQGETVTITATVKNNDIRDVKNPFKVAFYDGNPDQGGQKIGADQTIASLDGQASSNVSVQWTVPTSETHSIHVFADAYNEVEEINENNNTAVSQINVLTNRGYEITVAADRDSYAPGETVSGAMSVKNLGTASAGGTVEIAVKDAEGNLISSLSREYVADLAAGATHNFTRTWPIPSGTAGGQYRIEASVFETNVKMASNYDSFQVQNLFGVKPGISSDRLSYPANTDVVLSSKVASASANFTYRDLKVTVSVISPDSTELMSNSYTVPELQPGRVDLQKINWNTAVCSPGQYTARQKIYDNDGTTLLAQREAVFTIMSSLDTGGFAGSISVTPQTVEGGSAYGISYEIRNTGNVDIADAELVKLVVNRATLQNVGTYSEPLSLQKGQTYQNRIENIQTSGYSFQKYLVFLRLKKAGRESTVAATYLVMADTVPPVITNLSPVNGTLTNNGSPLVKALLSDNFSGIDDSSIVFKIDGAVFPTMYDNLTGFVSVTPETPLQDGVHALSLSVRDLAGNSAATPEWKITVDANPPQIASFIPENGSLLKVSPPEISAVITDAVSGVRAASITMTVDGSAATFAFDATTGKIFCSPANLADGVHTVSVGASDNAGNAATAAQWQFTVDAASPVFTGLAPANGTLTKNNQIALSAKVADALSGVNAQTVSISVDGTAVNTAFDPATGILTAASPQLADGLHTIVATASDMVGNQGTAPEWKITVDTVPPVISDLSPANGSNVNEGMPVISAKVSDALSGIKVSSITMSIAGTAAQVSYDPATGIVTATPPAQLQSGDIAIVLYVEDNAGNSSTTAGAWVFKVQTWLLFHNSSSGQLKISGSKKAFNGRVHSNAAIKISGSDNDITGRTTAVGSIGISGSGNDVPDKQANAPVQPMPVYDFDAYVARAAFTHNGDWHITKNDPIAAGIHYVNGNVKISGSNVTGNVTIVATGYIKVSGSGADFANADAVTHMLFFSKTGDIDISGSNTKLKGILYAPRGACSISGSGEDFQGAVIADSIDISGSNKDFGALE